MAEKILKTRTQISSSVRNDLWEWMRAESERTDVPISKLIDRAIEALKKEREPSNAKT